MTGEDWEVAHAAFEDPKRKTEAYYQLSYTRQMKSRTDYIPGAYVSSCAARSASMSTSRSSPPAGLS
jgi:hypothetical protein